MVVGRNLVSNKKNGVLFWRAIRTAGVRVHLPSAAYVRSTIFIYDLRSTIYSKYDLLEVLYDTYDGNAPHAAARSRNLQYVVHSSRQEFVGDSKTTAVYRRGWSFQASCLSRLLSMRGRLSSLSDPRISRLLSRYNQHISMTTTTTTTVRRDKASYIQHLD